MSPYTHFTQETSHAQPLISSNCPIFARVQIVSFLFHHIQIPNPPIGHQPIGLIHLELHCFHIPENTRLLLAHHIRHQHVSGDQSAD